MNKRPPLKSLYAFVAVAETGSMTEAAGVLSVSHSAISQAIKSLESIIGQPLFQRVGRQVQLNSVGQKYYNDIAPALKTIVDATEAVTHQPQSNRITLNMINSLAIHWWVPRVDNFQQYAPNADIRLSNLIGPFDLNQEGVDVAIIHGKSDEWEDYYCESSEMMSCYWCAALTCWIHHKTSRPLLNYCNAILRFMLKTCVESRTGVFGVRVTLCPF